MRKMQFGKGQVLVVAILAVMFVWMFIRQRDNTQSIGSGEGRKRSSYGGGAALKPRNSDELSSASRVDPAALLGAALASTITVSLSNGDYLWWSTISGHDTHYFLEAYAGEIGVIAGFGNRSRSVLLGRFAHSYASHGCSNPF